MPNKHAFTAIIQNAGGGGAFVEVPFDVEAAFGSKKPRVKALIEGVEYRGTLVRMGTERHLLLVLKSIREQVDKLSAVSPFTPGCLYFAVFRTSSIVSNSEQTEAGCSIMLSQSREL